MSLEHKINPSKGGHNEAPKTCRPIDAPKGQGSIHPKTLSITNIERAIIAVCGPVGIAQPLRELLSTAIYHKLCGGKK